VGIILSLSSAVIGLYVVILSYRTVKDYFAPWSIYTAAWSLMFGVFFLNIISYSPVSSTAWFLFMLGTFGFYMGTVHSLILTRHWLQSHVSDRSYWRRSLSEGRLRYSIYVLFILGGIGQFIYFKVIDDTFGISNLWENPGLIRTSQDQPSFISAFFWGKFLWYLNWLVCVLVVFYTTSLQKRVRVDMILVFFVALVSLLTSVERGSFVLVAIWSVLTLIYVQRSISKQPSRRNGIIIVIVATVASLAYFIFQGTRLGKTEFAITLAGGFNIPYLSSRPIESPLVSSYVYLTGNIPAFDQYVLRTNEFTWGTFSLLPFFKILTKLLRLDIPLPSEVGIFVNIPFPFNTYTYLNSAYSDFGVVGVIIYPLLMGFLATYLYMRMRRNPTLGNVVGTALVSHGLLLSVSTNRFVSTPFWEFMILLYFLSRFVHVPLNVHSSLAQNRRSMK